VLILGQILVLGVLLPLYKKSKNEGEHRDRVSTMHNVLLWKLLKMRGTRNHLLLLMIVGEVMLGGSGLEVQRDAAEA